MNSDSSRDNNGLMKVYVKIINMWSLVRAWNRVEVYVKIQPRPF
jgi:hypothetical protein